MAQLRAFGEPPLPRFAPPSAPLARHKALLLVLMAALWIGAGLIGRDPWKPQETLFVAAIALENGALPDLPPAALPDSPPSLYLQMASASARLFADALPLHEGARIVNAFLLALGLLFCGLATGRGTRGGWIAALLILGMAGFMIRSHLLNLAIPAFFGSAAMLWGAVRLRKHALVGGAIVGSSAAFLFAAASPAISLFALAGVCGAMFREKWRRGSIIAGMLAAMAFFIPAALLSPTSEGFIASFAIADGWMSASAVVDLIRLSAWALFPALPLAAASLWRRRSADTVMFLCLTMSAAATMHFILYGKQEEDLFWLMPPLAVLTARGIDALPGEGAKILDWFAVVVVGICCVGGMWAAWIIWQSGLDTEWMQQWSARFPLLQTPDFATWKIVLAVFITVLWAGIAANFGRSNERAILNWSCGVTVAWCVFNLLWTPVVDSGKSYRHMAGEISARSGEECVHSSAAVGATAAQIYYWGVRAGPESCSWLLARDSDSVSSTFQQVWQGGRYNQKNFVLYRRQ